MEVRYEKGFPSDLLKELSGKEHQIKEESFDSGFAALTAISRAGDSYEAVFDPRRGGSSEIFTV